MSKLPTIKSVLAEIKGASEDDLATVGLEAAIDEACGFDLDERKQTYRARLQELTEKRRLRTQ